MKLLLDENLSPNLAQLLADLFPGSAHVGDCGLGAASDEEVWEFAKKRGFVVVSKDSDFYDRSSLLGSPPQVIWLRLGNRSTDEIEGTLRHHAVTIAAFGESAQAALVILPVKTRTR